MKNIINIIQNLYYFVKNNRRGGTSSLIKKISDENDVWVLVPDKKTGEALNLDDKKIVSYDNIDEKLGYHPKPILVDNYFMISLLDEVGENINKLNKEKNNYKEKLEFVYNEIGKELGKY